MASQYLKIGKIVNTFGIRGEMKVFIYTDFPEERFKSGNKLYIGQETNPTQVEVTVKSAKPYKNLYLLKFENLDNINDVEKYKNNFLWVSKDVQGELNEGEFYYHEIIGCKVLTVEGEELGEIYEILDAPANDVWIVRAYESGQDLLIPYIESVVMNVNVEEKTVTIKLLEGLLDI